MALDRVYTTCGDESLKVCLSEADIATNLRETNASLRDESADEAGWCAEPTGSLGDRDQGGGRSIWVNGGHGFMCARWRAEILFGKSTRSP
jgi:hypothetical protein